MKILYFAGLASITDPDYDICKSNKFLHLSEIAECESYDYHSFAPETFLSQISAYDVLFGSSFGGFFSFFGGISTGKTTIMVNPSLKLDERIELLKTIHGEKLSFIDQNMLKKIKTTPNGSKYQNINAFMNLDDEVISASDVIEVSKTFSTNIHTFEKGRHESHNFQGEMLPIIKRILTE